MSRGMAGGPIGTQTAARYKWTVVALLWLAVFFNYADRQAIFSTLPLLKTEFAMSNAELGLLGSVFLWVYSPFSPLAGYLGDRFRRKSVILASLVIWSAVTFFTGLAQSARQLLILRAAMGLSEAAYFPSALALIGDYHDRRSRSRAVAIHGTGVNLGVIGGGVIAAYVAEVYGWRPAFYLFGVLGVALFFFLRLAIVEPERGAADAALGDGHAEVPDPASPRVPLRKVVGSLLATPGVLLMVAAFLGTSAATWIFRSWMPFYLHQHFGMSLTMAGVSATLYAEGANLCAALAGGVLGDRAAARGRAGRVLVLVGGLLLGVPFILLVGSTASTGVLVAALVGFGVSQGLYYANFAPALYDIVPPSQRATAIGVSNLAWGIGGGGATLAAGLLSERVSWIWILSGTAGIYLASAALLAVWAGALARGSGRSVTIA